MDLLLAPFVYQRNIVLKTRKRDGTWVGTPVNIVVDGDRAYFRTWSTSGKAKRLRNFSDVEFAPSTARGRQTGPGLRAQAHLLTGDDAARARHLITRKYPVLQGVLVPLAHKVGRHHTEHYVLSDFHPISGTAIGVTSRGDADAHEEP
jgi:PPOX class probable F420-dependent enzyme